MKYKRRKRFGQHFLHEPEIINQIISVIAPLEGQKFVEIGPGDAAITEPLADLVTTLHAIEIDRNLTNLLLKKFVGRENITIHESDVLNFDFEELGYDLRLVGNLPYNISTPLLFYLLSFCDHIMDAHFMLQKEVADRICATHGSKSYGRLTIMLGCRMETARLFDVSPESFDPPPKVMSTVVRMRMYPKGTFEIRDDETMEAIVKQAFSKRRKTLRNALSNCLTCAEIEAIGIDSSQRPEQVAITDWIALANSVSG